jgi:hypothetical protein
VNRAKLALPYDSQSVKLDSVKFLSDKVDLNEEALNVYEFFSIDLKKFRLFLLNENGLSSSKNLQTINNLKYLCNLTQQVVVQAPTPPASTGKAVIIQPLPLPTPPVQALW